MLITTGIKENEGLYFIQKTRNSYGEYRYMVLSLTGENREAYALTGFLTALKARNYMNKLLLCLDTSRVLTTKEITENAVCFKESKESICEIVDRLLKETEK